MICIIADLQLAKKTVLSRPADEPDYPAELLGAVERIFGEPLSPPAAVARVLADVRARGDLALREWSQRIDESAPDPLALPDSELAAAATEIPADLAEALQLATERIRAFHALQPVRSWETSELGGVMGQRMIPLRRVGVYVPGGTAPLPSSLLMGAIPAQVAGVNEIVVCTPPGREGAPLPAVLRAAAHMLGIEKIFQLGGAQAVAAMAYGTDTVPRVNKIVGPGNLFVTLAKKQVFGEVGIDGLAGPTETVIVADDSANSDWVAADLLAQAEHDVFATAILLTPSRTLAEAVQAAVVRQMENLSRIEILARSLPSRGGIVLTPDLETAVDLADRFAPEHLCLVVAQPERWAEQVRNAGCLFVGEGSFEVLGDYVAGPNHILPTGGTARFASPLNVLDFVRIMSVVQLDEETTAQMSPAAALLASAEQLDGHAAAAERRIEEMGL